MYFFWGYASTQKGYKCFDPRTQEIYASMDVSFLENHPYFSQNSLRGEKSNVEDNF